MYHYTVTQWIFFFYVYCFLGWCVETTYVSVKKRHFVNRGFMRGPFLPLYGSGGIMMLVVSMPFRGNIILTYIAGCVGATILEYITGVVMEALFKVRYWDYSYRKFNFQGHICLNTSLSWGFLTVLVTDFLHKWVEHFAFTIPSPLFEIITYVLTVGIVVDFALAFKAALDLRDVLVKMEKAKEELLHVQKRLDEMLEHANEELSTRRAEFSESMNEKREAFAESMSERKEAFGESMSMRMDELKSSVEDRLLRLKSIAVDRPGEYWESINVEYQELKAKYTKSLEESRYRDKFMELFQKALIRSHPTMTSERFKESLEELKVRAERFGKKEKSDGEG